jgi:signal transduction histidine kinase
MNFTPTPTTHTDAFIQEGGETGKLIRNFDWASTSLGVPSAWPSALKVAVYTMLRTTVPTHISWGKEYIQLYNDAAISTFDKGRHPAALGSSLKNRIQVWKILEPVFATIMAGGKEQQKDLQMRIDTNGFIEERYVDIFYAPICNDDWTIGGVQTVVFETTDKVNAFGQLKEDALKLRSIIDEATIAICFFVGKEMTIEMANTAMRNIWDKGADVIGKTLEDALPELKGQPFLDLLQDVYKTGKTFEAKASPAHLEVNGVLDTFYFDYSYVAIRNSSGEIYGILNMATDVTSQVLALQHLHENKSQLDFTIEATQLGIWNLNPLTNTFTGNNRLKEWFGLSTEEEISLKAATDVIADKDRSAVENGILNALQPNSGGKYDVEYTIIHPVTKKETIVHAKGKALFTEDGRAYQFSGTLQDVTEDATLKKQLALDLIEQKIARDKLEESELFSSSVIYHSPVAKIVYIGKEMRIKIANENMLDLIGRNNSILGKTFDEVLPELKNTPIPLRMQTTFRTGATYVQPEEKISLVRFGEEHVGYYNYTYKALRSISGDIYGIIVTATEITDQVTARQQIEVKEKELRELITAAPIGICVVSGRPLWAEEVNDRFLLISGKTREQFNCAPYWEVLSEIAFLFEETLNSVFETGKKFTSEEHEMVLLRVGVEEKVFVTFEYIPVLNSDNIVTKVIILTIEVTHQVETRKKIEQAVIERTKELAELNHSLIRSNNELEQFAHIASHDLQEPIRKISLFTQMLEQNIPEMNDKAKKYFDKINTATERMTKLIRDVLAFSQVTQSTEAFVHVDLAQTVQHIRSDYELVIESTGAEIIIENLPIIHAIPAQMIQLFSNLMSNALKYTRMNVQPIIQIKCTTAKKDIFEKHPQLNVKKEYHLIEFSDNGIGFKEDDIDRIFKIFQRLHSKADYEGTGIGLSICRKIIQNHSGHISASTGENGGAVFHILLPKN